MTKQNTNFNDAAANTLTVWADLLPLDVSSLLTSKTWHKMSHETKSHLIGALATFTEIVEKRQEHWHKKGTIKGEFLANVLSDFEWDFVDDTLMNFDEQLKLYWDGEADQYADHLIDQAMHYKHWDKVIKDTYKSDKSKIVSAVIEPNGSINLDDIGDITPDYRDILY